MANAKRGGYRVAKDPRTGIYLARWWQDGRGVKRSTGARDLAEAHEQAKEMYAAAISGREQTDRRITGELAPVVAKWLASIEGVVSVGDWERCEMTFRVHVLPRIARIEQLTPASCEDFYRARLRHVARSTVKRERGVLVRFVKWASRSGRNLVPAFEVPTMPKKAKGTKKLEGRDETEITRDEMLAICDALPNRSRLGHPVKQLATLVAELGVRFETAQKLSVPQHWQPGSDELRITSEIDKEGVSRSHWLSPRAQRALADAARGAGPIFGEFSYYKTLRAAARRIIGDERAQHLSLRDFRHACLSAIEAEHGIQAAAYVAGHKSTETAARRYVLPKQREARAALESLAAKDRTGHKPGTWTIEAESEFTLPCDSWQTRRDSNPRLLPPEGSALSG